MMRHAMCLVLAGLLFSCAADVAPPPAPPLPECDPDNGGIELPDGFCALGVAEGPDGSLYISDSVKGRIWRVIPKSSR